MKESRSYLLPLLAGAAAAGAAALAAHALFVEPTDVELSKQDLAIPHLPSAWENKRVVHLTDLHYGDPRSEKLFTWMVRTVNDLEPDLIVITGDYVVCRANEAIDAARHLAGLRARHGVIGVLGDHDFSVRKKREIRGLVERLTEANVRLLRNSAVELPGGLWVAGVEPTTRKLARADLESAIAEVPDRKPHLLLSHAPDIIPEASSAGVPLVLCGHTHGGQVVVPFFGPPVTHSNVPRRFASGWSQEKETRMYTGRGLASHHSLRFCCRPEITEFTLRRAVPAQARDDRREA